ncbi:class I-like SAM-binding methyltransferase superfamily [Mactra antiquata]
MSNVEQIVEIALIGARDCLNCKNYGRAFANLLLFLKLKPGRASEVYNDFALATREWFGQLERQSRIDDLFKCYDQAYELFPHHDTVFGFVGAQLFRLGFMEKAAMYIRKSLLLNPNDLLARNNLENICSHLVERWHFSMLNDKRRNMAFKCAIDKAVKSGYSTVLDVGTGTGILSMMAEMSGAVKVMACDGSQTMIEVAEDVFDANGVSNRINLLHKHSTELQIPQDIPNRVKLLVTETFDAGLFGEHIVSTLIHAWKNLISTSPMGTVIPCGATIYVCGIECNTIRQQSRFLYPVLQYLDVNQIELLCNTGQIAEDPYTTENLAKIKDGYKIITNITELMRVNFCNLWELETLNAGKDWLCELFVKQSGRIDALAVWFDLHLDDTVTIGTGPLNESCWEQVIYPITSVASLQNKDHKSFHVKKKDKLRSTFHFGCDCLTLTDCKIWNSSNNYDVGMTRTQESENVSVYQTSCKISKEECSPNCLPFRKRKMENVGYEDKKEIVSDDNELHIEEGPESVSEMNDVIDGVNESMEAYSSGVVKVDGNCPSFGLTSCDQVLAGNEFRESSELNPSGILKNTTSHSDLQASTFSQFGSKLVNQNLRYNKPLNSCSINDRVYLNGVTGVIDGDEELKTVNSLPDILHNIDLSKSDQVDGANSVNEQIESNEEKISEPSKQIGMEFKDSGTVYSHAINLHSDVGTDNCPTTVLPNVSKLTVYSEEADIRYINDIHLNRVHCNFLKELKSIGSNTKSILCISSRLSFIGIQAAVIGYTDVTIATNEEHHETLNHVALLNGCKDIVLTKPGDLDNLDTKFDLILCDVVESCGALIPRIFENMAGYRFSHLKSMGVLLPCKVKILGMFIECEELDTWNHVTGNDKTLGFQIADFINLYQMMNHVDLDLSTLNYTRLTEIQEMLSLDFSALTTETTSDFLTRTVEKRLEVSSSGNITAFVYWFELLLNENTVISTLNSCYHWKQACIMIDENVEVFSGQRVLTKLRLENSYLDVKVVQPPTCNGHI